MTGMAVLPSFLKVKSTHQQTSPLLTDSYKHSFWENIPPIESVQNDDNVENAKIELLVVSNRKIVKLKVMFLGLM